MKTLLRRLVVLSTPLILDILDSTHPVLPEHTNMFHGILPHVDWWLSLHLLQLPLLGLIALAAYLLTDGVHGVAATISRVALGVFVIFYPALDVLIGMSTGILVRYTASIPLSQQAVLEKAIDIFVQNPIANFVSVLGSLGWEVGVLAAALAICRPSKSRLLLILLALGAMLFGVWVLIIGFVTVVWWIGVLTLSIALGLTATPRLPMSFLVLASLLFGTSHLPPFGPLGMACFFVAALQLELFQKKQVLSSDGHKFVAPFAGENMRAGSLP